MDMPYTSGTAALGKMIYLPWLYATVDKYFILEATKFAFGKMELSA